MTGWKLHVISPDGHIEKILYLDNYRSYMERCDHINYPQALADDLEAIVMMWRKETGR